MCAVLARLSTQPNYGDALRGTMQGRNELNKQPLTMAFEAKDLLMVPLYKFVIHYDRTSKIDLVFMLTNVDERHSPGLTQHASISTALSDEVIETTNRFEAVRLNSSAWPTISKHLADPVIKVL